MDEDKTTKKVVKCMTFDEAEKLLADNNEKVSDSRTNQKSNGSSVGDIKSKQRAIPLEELISNDLKQIVENSVKEISDASKYTKLQMFDIDGGLLWKKKLNISCKGLETGLRNKKDGITFFGPIREFNNETVNDFVVNEECKNLVLNYFALYFIKERNSYLIRNLSRNSVSIYAKIEEPFPLSKGSNVFLIGEVTLNVDVDYSKE